MKFKDTIYKKQRLSADLRHPETGELLIPANRELTQVLIDRAESAGLKVTAEMFKLPRPKISPLVERPSPADICLTRADTWIDFNPKEQSVEFSDTWHQLHVIVEHRAWVCAFCGQSTEYLIVNNQVIKGCGSSAMISNGKMSQSCARPNCRDEQEKFHAEND
jgi:hypothetical protein